MVQERITLHSLADLGPMFPDAQIPVFASLPVIGKLHFVANQRRFTNVSALKFEQRTAVRGAFDMNPDERLSSHIRIMAIVPLDGEGKFIPVDILTYPVFVIFPNESNNNRYLSATRWSLSDTFLPDSLNDSLVLASNSILHQVDNLVVANAELIQELPLDMCRRLGQEVKMADSLIKYRKTMTGGIFLGNRQHGVVDVLAKVLTMPETESLNRVKSKRILQYLECASDLMQQYPGLPSLHTLSSKYSSDTLHVTLEMHLPKDNHCIMDRLLNPSLEIHPKGVFLTVSTNINKVRLLLGKQRYMDGSRLEPDIAHYKIAMILGI